MARKILMVGLGGTGCRAIAMVRERVIKEKKSADDPYFSDIAFVGFDTDLSDEGKDTVPMVVTSRNASVEDLLENRESWKEWFPSNNNFLLARNMLHGAGQIRVLSRLALEDTMSRRLSSDRPMAALDDALDQLQRQDGDPAPTDIVVMIVSSFAGGTGSGIFIQMALYLRKQIMERLHCNTAIIRGLFTLPDIYVKCQHGDMLIENVYANAYASLKELCAINRLFSGNDRLSDGIRMQFDGLFDSQADKVNGKLPITKVPYNFIFFIDNTNERGKTLSTIEAYEKQLADVAYMQLYSPMANNIYSEEDNRIRDLISSQGQKIYGSAGYSRIIYPHDDVVEYCAKRMMSESMSSTWLGFDELYREALSDAKQRKKTDPSFPEPKKDVFFMDNVSKVLYNGSAQFPFLIDEVIVPPQENESELLPTERQDLFFEDVLSYINSQVNGVSAKNITIKQAATDASSFTHARKKQDIIQQIQSSENALRRYKQAVDEQVRSTCRTIMYDIIPNSLATRKSDNPYCLSTLLHYATDPEKAVHPLSVRYMLYKFREMITLELKDLDVRGQNKKIEKHLGRVDWDERKDGVQSLGQAVPKVFRRSFVDQYSETREECFSNITKYAADYMKQEVLKLVKERIDLLLKHYENMFDCLSGIIEDINRDVSRLETMHDINSETDTFVCASSSYKRTAYRHISMRNTEIGDTLYESIFSVIWQAVLNEEDKRNELGADTRDKKEIEALEKELRDGIRDDVRSLFDTRVADAFRKAVLEDQTDAVNIDIIKAIDKQCKEITKNGNYTSVDEPRTKLLDSTRVRAMPRLIFNQNIKSMNSTIFWGLNDRAAAPLVRDNRKGTYFNNETSVVSSGYSPYEISCYRAVYTLALSDIPKFSDIKAKQGIYFENYESLRNRMGGDNSREDALTPHVDLRWIDRSYLPMISDTRNDEESSNAATALLLGIAYRNIFFKRVDGADQVFVHFADPCDPVKAMAVHPLLLDGNRIIGKDKAFISIYQALRDNSVLTDQLLQLFRHALDTHKRVTVHTEKGLTGGSNPLVTAMIDAPSGSSQKGNGTNMLTVLYQVLKDDLIREEEEKKPLLSSALLELVDQELMFTKETGKKAFKELIYRYSIFERNPKGTAEVRSSLLWLDSWVSAASAVNSSLEDSGAEDAGEVTE